MDSALRPREIQARIRSGESAEQVATAAGTSVEQIMPYAGPVLAERAHVAQTALRASVRRSAAAGKGARTLGDAVATVLGDHGLRDDDVEWDSWRRPDGRWALVARLTVSGRELQAELVHDMAGRYVVAQNDDARLLVGEAASAPADAPEDAPLDAPPVSHLTAVSPLGDDAIELVRDPEPEPEPEQPALDLGPEHGTAPEGAPQPEDQQPAPERRKRKGRASVPSWDEIMFGGSKD